MGQETLHLVRLVGEYSLQQRVYEDLCHETRHIVETLLAQADIKVHSVTCRSKTLTSLEDKLRREPRRYGRLCDVTDLAGVRIITYFEDDVDRVGALIRQEFEVHPANSVDKRALMDPDRFGYLSLHYVVALGPQRSTLTEYARFQSLPIEIQIRSVLQHAWAEIEHDLGYKVKETIPAGYRRAFARIAGLLEIADAEFTALRDGLRQYAVSITGRLEESPEDTGIDRESLLSFLRTSGIARDVDAELASIFRMHLTDPNDFYVDSLVKALASLGIGTILELQVALQQHRGHIVSFARAMPYLVGFEHDASGAPRGTCIDLMSVYSVLERNGDLQEFHGEAWGVPGEVSGEWTAGYEKAYRRFLQSASGSTG